MVREKSDRKEKLSQIQEKRDKEMSRRSFLKLMGYGTALGAAGFIGLPHLDSDLKPSFIESNLEGNLATGKVTGESSNTIQENSVGPKTITVPGDYDSLQDAVRNGIPDFIDDTVTINITGSLDDEDVYLPPYLANFLPDELGGKPAILINGNGQSINSFMATAGIGICRVKNMTFTGSSPYDNENAAVSSYETDRIELVDCEITHSSGGSSKAMISYTGTIAANGVNVSGNPDTGIKAKSLGWYREFGNNTSGSAGKAYELDEGYIEFNSGNNGHMSGSIDADNPSDGGLVIDLGNNRIYGVN